MRPAACAHELLEDKAPLDKPSRGGGCALRAAGCGLRAAGCGLRVEF
jgi:hypothetical protein